MFMLIITKKIYISELSFGNWDLSSLPVSQTEGREWTCLPQIYDVSDGQSLGWISAVSHNPMQMSKTERRGKRRTEKRRERGNLNLESFHFLRLEQVKIDVFMAGQASVAREESPYRAAQSGQR